MSEALGLTQSAMAGLGEVADMVGQPASNFANSGGAYTLGIDTGVSSFGEGGGGLGASIGAAIGAAVAAITGDSGPSPE